MTKTITVFATGAKPDADKRVQSVAASRVP